MNTVDILYPSSQVMEVLKKQERKHALSYFCKICSKRFVSGRALGGHMRAHAPASIGADTLTETEFQKSKRKRASNHKSMEEREKDEEDLDSNGSNLMYALRKNPKRSWRFADRDYSFLLGHDFDSKSIDSSINCDLCGKEFSSWKSLFGHMKCHSDTHQDISDAHLEESELWEHETQDDEAEESESDAEIEIAHPRQKSSRFHKWKKGKRSRRPRHSIQHINPCEQFGSETINEVEEMAMCLVMLANEVSTVQKPLVQVGAEEPGSVDLKLPNTDSQLSKCMRKKLRYKKIDGDVVLYADDGVKKARYKCITCNKVFHSHQALGGHRTSHNKIKGSFLQTEEENESPEEEIADEELITGSDSYQEPRSKERTKNSCVNLVSLSGKKSLRVHECSICHRVFYSGQALGGHKRGHWSGAGASDTLSTISSNKDSSIQQQQMPARVELLDLNLPAPVYDDSDDYSDAGNFNKLGGNAVGFDGASYDQTHGLPSLQPWLMGSYQKQGLLLYSNHTDFK